ncbi:efflux transporter outer membrane subunit [Jannaschia sp. W003]|uniref:efflux transporter outer membrane subunit n=1 Tax=Jannaschia sp. W003 TaxID=2867012 RepID=UPI0021A81605|nr:efflux transporter outer membrane subunit [Jannaschia sp. W003]UWQ23179.1 efflux transporter outer membrane subunit [Jannaschia sp. W003]
MTDTSRLTTGYRAGDTICLRRSRNFTAWFATFLPRFVASGRQEGTDTAPSGTTAAIRVNLGKTKNKIEHPMIRSLIAPLALILGGCITTVGPDSARPEVAVAREFAFAVSPDLEGAASEAWWLALDDSTLDAFMARGLRQNLDIRTARARIAQARARVRAAGAAQLSGDLDVTLNRTVSDGRTSGSEVAAGGATYAFDLFGGQARRRQAVRAELEATLLDEAATQLAFQLELATAMIEVRFFQNAQAVTERSIADRRRLLALTRELVAAGEMTAVNEARAQADLSLVEAELPGLRAGVQLNTIRVATLIDMPVSAVAAAIGRAGQLRPRHTVAPGVPANLLRNRPDVLAAEYRLAKALAEIGVAEAALYPALTLNGTIQLDSKETFRLGPTLSLPLLSRGRLIALRDETAAEAAEAEILWRQELTQAVSDVESALVRAATSRREIAALTRASADYARLEALSQDTLRLGVTTILELISAAQDRRRTDLSLASARRDLATAVAQLAVATGRGWKVGIPDADGGRDLPDASAS